MSDSQGTRAWVPYTDWLEIGLIGVGLFLVNLSSATAGGLCLLLGALLAQALAHGRVLVRTELDWPMFLVPLPIAASLWVTSLPQVTQPKVVRLLANVVGFYAVIGWTRTRGRLLLVANGLVGAGAALALAAPFVVNWNRTAQHFVPARMYESFRLLVSDSVEPNTMGALMVLILPVALACFLSVPQGNSRRKRRVGQLALAMTCLLMAAVLVLTKARVGIFVATLGCLAVLWNLGRRRQVLIVVAVCAGLGVSLALGVLGPGSTQLAREFTRTESWIWRQRVWNVALQMLTDFPLMGVGMGAFNDVAAQHYGFRQRRYLGTHNLYLQVWLDLGLSGLLAYCVVQLRVIQMAARAACAFREHGDQQLWALGLGAIVGMVAVLCLGLMNVVAWGTRAAFLPWLVAGLMVSLQRRAPRNGSRRATVDAECVRA